MDIYLDFEATQFTERIIAIGATCVRGDFDCLVAPSKKDKITKFITELTGISKEMLNGAPTAEEAFFDLYSWLMEVSEGPTFFHVYGDMDKIYLQKTAEKVSNPAIKNFMLDLAESVIDDAKAVQRFFHIDAIGLHKALTYFIPDLAPQDHDPLNDAILLSQLMSHIRCTNPPEENPFGEKKATKPAPEAYGPRNRVFIRATHLTEKNAKPKVFLDYKIAYDWAIAKCIKKNPATKNFDKIKKKVKEAIDTNGEYLGWRWEKCFIKEGE